MHLLSSTPSSSSSSLTHIAAATLHSSSPHAQDKDDESHRALILEPLQGKEGTDLALVFCPGAFTAAQDYLPLMKLVQSSSSLKLWIIILNPEDELVATKKILASWNGIWKRLNEQGFRAGEISRSNILLAGHSLGGWEARSVAFKLAECFMQFGCRFHPSPDSLAQYPIPVLTLNGELDGQITIASMAKHAGEILETEPERGEINTFCVKPVIIIPGMNHSQFSHGHPNKERGDRDAEISLDSARSIISEIVSAFVAVHFASNRENGKGNEAFKKLKNYVTQTHILYRPFWEAINRQGAEAKEWQLAVAAFKGLTEANIAVTQHDHLDYFIYSKPWIHAESCKIYVQSYLKSTEERPGIIKSLWIKMKSHEAVILALKRSSNVTEDDDSNLKSISAAELNGITFSRALGLVHESSRKNYTEAGKKPRFVDDLLIKDSAQTWIDSDVTFSPAADASGFVDIQSPVIITPTDGIASRFAGMHYMKLLTVAGAMRWILEDSFRP